MLWINGQVTSVAVMKALFIPSIVSMLVTLLLLGFRLKGDYHVAQDIDSHKKEPGATLVFCFGVGGLIFVPIFKA